VDWSFRKNLIFEEINAVCADIICLQEYEESVGEEFFDFNNQYGVESMNISRDFEILFSKKSSPKKKDGCAILVDKNKFEILDYFTLDLSIVPQLDLSVLADRFKNPESNTNSPRSLTDIFKNTETDPEFQIDYEDGSELNRLNFRNLAMFCVVQRKNDINASPILIANTHLIFSPEKGEVKFGQYLLILRTIDYLQRK